MLDPLGLDHTTHQPLAIERWHDTLAQYLASSRNTMAALEGVLEADPDMPMALLFRGYLLKLAADPRLRSPIRALVKGLTARDDLNEREQMHRQALTLWEQDLLEETARICDEIVLRYPKDILALRIAHYLYFYGKGGDAMLTSLANATSHWSPGDPFYGYLKGMLAFAQEESGDYSAAEASGREALDIAPHDIWAAHAVTHVYQMQSRFAEGVPFIESLAGNWSAANNFVNHMHWHKALQHIGLGEPEAALAIYDADLVQPLQDDFYLDVCNAASLLWRLDMLGVDTGDRWAHLNDISKQRVTDNELVFSTLHYLMAPAVMGDTGTVDQCLAQFDKWSASSTSQGDVARHVGQAVARAIGLLASRQSIEGATLLGESLHSLHEIGGSHAQRELFTDLVAHYGNNAA